MKIVDQYIKVSDAVWEGDKNNIRLITKYSDGVIKSEQITPEQAAQWSAEHGF